MWQKRGAIVDVSEGAITRGVRKGPDRACEEMGGEGEPGAAAKRTRGPNRTIAPRWLRYIGRSHWEKGSPARRTL